MLYEFVSLEDFLEQLEAFGIKDLWVTARLQLLNYNHHPLRYHYTAEAILSTRVPQGIAFYRQTVGGDCRRGATAMELAKEVSHHGLIMRYFDSPKLEGFALHYGLWVAPSHCRPILVQPNAKGGDTP